MRKVHPLTYLFLSHPYVSFSQIENTCFSMTFFGEGYSEGTDPSQGRPNAKICTQVVGAGKTKKNTFNGNLMVN